MPHARASLPSGNAWTWVSFAWLFVAIGCANPDPVLGRRVYETSGACWVCHGRTGEGNGPAHAALIPPPRDFSKGHFRLDADGDGQAGTDEDLKLVILNGAAAYGGSPSMTPWSHLGKARVADLVAYIRTLEEPGEE